MVEEGPLDLLGLGEGEGETCKDPFYLTQQHNRETRHMEQSNNILVSIPVTVPNKMKYLYQLLFVYHFVHVHNLVFKTYKKMKKIVTFLSICV